MSEEIDIARQWVVKAKNDLLNADNNLKAKEVPFDTVCFHCQQATEKFLKAFLVGNRQEPLYTHDLLFLLNKVLSVRSDAECLRDPLSILMPYAIEVRYPDDWYMPSEDDAKEAYDAAIQVMKWINKIIPSIF